MPRRAPPGHLILLASDECWVVGIKRVQRWIEAAPWSRIRGQHHIYKSLAKQAPDAMALELTATKVRELRDNRTPGAARTMLKALSALYRWGMEYELVTSNPVAGVKRPKVSKTGFIPWTVDDIHKFRTAYCADTKQHLAMCLLLFTACRRSDVIRLGPQHAGGGWMRWSQGKTGDLVEVPILPPLAEAIELTEPALVFLRTEFGRPFTVAGFGNWWGRQVREAGISAAPAHGLRKAAGGLLAEFGCSEREIMSVLGHSDPGTARIYTRSANRRLLAENAMNKMREFTW